MNDATETVILMVCLATVFTTGYIVGGGATEINYTQEDELGYQQITYEGEINRGRYTFKFQEEISQDKYEENVTVQGRAFSDPLSGRRTVKLRTNREASEVLETCRHEILHYYFPDYEHPDFSKPEVTYHDDPIYRLEDKVDFGICRDVVATALMKQK